MNSTLNGQLLLGSLVIVATVVFHVAGLVVLAGVLRRLAAMTWAASQAIVNMGLLVLAVLAIIGIHTVEAWTWAAVFLSVGGFADFETALYFSVVTSTTLGYGDVTLPVRWRFLGSFEAMGGLLLFGASTAFLLGYMRDLFEHGRGDRRHEP